MKEVENGRTKSAFKWIWIGEGQSWYESWIESRFKSGQQGMAVIMKRLLLCRTPPSSSYSSSCPLDFLPLLVFFFRLCLSLSILQPTRPSLNSPRCPFLPRHIWTISSTEHRKSGSQLSEIMYFIP